MSASSGFILGILPDSALLTKEVRKVEICTGAELQERQMDPAIILFGLGIGVLVGMTGMGGGSLMTPMLILVFGIQPTTAIGTDIFYSAVTKTVGAWRHFRMKTVNLGLTVWLAAGSVPAAILGVFVISVLKDHLGEDQLNSVVYALLGGTLLM